MSRKIGAFSYCETSAKTGEGVEELLEVATQKAIGRANGGGLRKRSGLGRLFGIK